jgi:hypothetical protein
MSMVIKMLTARRVRALVVVMGLFW